MSGHSKSVIKMLQYYNSHCVQSMAVAVHRVSVKVELPAVQWPPRLSSPLLWLVSNAGPAPALAPVLPLATLLQDLQVL